LGKAATALNNVFDIIDCPSSIDAVDDDLKNEKMRLDLNTI